MKGHLGFRCRTCLRPSAPLNLRQDGTGSNASLFSGTLEWDEPADIGGGPITAYRVEMFTGYPTFEWQTLVTVGGSTRQAYVTWCRETGSVRVIAQNRCGWGVTSSVFSGWVFSNSNTQLFTASATVSLPCWANSFKAWTVGPGGVAAEGGTAGGLSWKTWSIDLNAAAPAIVVQNENLYNQGGGFPHSRITYRGQTLRSEFGGNSGTSSGGDGSTNGGGYSGLSPDGQNWEWLLGYPWYTRWYRGGSIAGAGNGTAYGDANAVEQCKRIPLRAAFDGGVLSAAAACGLKTVEDCSSEGAFGSGGVKVPLPSSSYGTGGFYYFQPGYGGGGFDANSPGGPGCVIVQFLS